MSNDLQYRKVTVTIPKELLEKVDDARMETESRSAWLRKAARARLSTVNRDIADVYVNAGHRMELVSMEDETTLETPIEEVA